VRVTAIRLALAAALTAITAAPNATAGIVDPFPSYDSYREFMDGVIGEIVTTLDLGKRHEDYARTTVGAWVYFYQCRDSEPESKGRVARRVAASELLGGFSMAESRTASEVAILAIAGAYFRQHSGKRLPPMLCRYAKEQGLPKELW
jgi:hypothetical protein